MDLIEIERVKLKEEKGKYGSNIGSYNLIGHILSIALLLEIRMLFLTVFSIKANPDK
jgi:hypothetical protein